MATEQRMRREMERAWERILAREGLTAELDPIEEGSRIENPEDGEAEAATATEETILAEAERRIVERVKDLGWAATLTEANATDEQIARLADSGTAFLRAADSGETVLAMANATRGDVQRAAKRIEKPPVEKFIPKANRPATPAVMFLDHHIDKPPADNAAKARAAEEFRAAARRAGATGRRKEEAVRQTARRIVERLRRDGQETSRVMSAGQNPQRAWAVMERLEEKGLVSRTYSRRDGTVFRWEGCVPPAEAQTPRRERHWTQEPSLRRSIAAQLRSGQAARNTAKAAGRRLARRAARRERRAA